VKTLTGSFRDDNNDNSVLYLFMCLLNSLKVNDDDVDDDDDDNNDNSIKFFTYLRDELNSQGPITESA
jgi:hypothetical protein